MPTASAIATCCARYFSPAACLCADDPPRASTRDPARARRHRRHDARARPPVRRPVQRPPPAHRHLVGNSLQSLPGRRCGLLAALRALHRPQPRPRPQGRDPTRFPWSSGPALCSKREDPLLTLHPRQQALGKTTAERAKTYRALLAQAFNEHGLADIRTYLQQQRTYGRDAFQAMVEAKTNRFAGMRPAHRPKHAARSTS